jgi:hypothetical protein
VMRSGRVPATAGRCAALALTISTPARCLVEHQYRRAQLPRPSSRETRR